jgi:hypothetical protein
VLGALDGREVGPQSRDDLADVVHRQRGLGGLSQLVGLAHLQGGHVVEVLLRQRQKDDPPRVSGLDTLVAQSPPCHMKARQEGRRLLQSLLTKLANQTARLLAGT